MHNTISLHTTQMKEKSTVRDEIAAQTRDYLARGNIIEEIPVGNTAMDISKATYNHKGGNDYVKSNCDS